MESKKRRSNKKSRRSNKKSSKKQVNPSRATDSMSLTKLQIMAKTRGIAFGGLSKTQLIYRINHYH